MYNTPKNFLEHSMKACLKEKYVFLFQSFIISYLLLNIGVITLKFELLTEKYAMFALKFIITLSYGVFFVTYEIS